MFPIITCSDNHMLLWYNVFLKDSNLPNNNDHPTAQNEHTSEKYYCNFCPQGKCPYESLQTDTSSGLSQSPYSYGLLTLSLAILTERHINTTFKPFLKSGFVSFLM